MKKFNGGSSVSGGYYWHTQKWEVMPIKDETGVLPGDKGDTFVKVSIPMLLVLAPAIGGAYALFLPFIGFAMATYAFGRKIGLISSKAMDETAAAITPAWRPGETYFAGKAAEAKPKQAPAPNGELDALAAEVESRRDDPVKR